MFEVWNAIRKGFSEQCPIFWKNHAIAHYVSTEIEQQPQTGSKSVCSMQQNKTLQHNKKTIADSSALFCT